MLTTAVTTTITTAAGSRSINTQQKYKWHCLILHLCYLQQLKRGMLF